MYDSFAISPSHCAPKSLADRSTYVFLVARPACNVQITLPASPPTILFWFEQAIAFLPIHLFYIYIYIYIIYILSWICLNTLRFNVSSTCLFSISVCSQRLSRVIHLHVFSCQVGTQCADYITYLSNITSVLVYRQLHFCQFSSLLISYIFEFEYA